MRAHRSLPFAAAAAAFAAAALVVSGCGPARHEPADGAATTAPRTAVSRAADAPAHAHGAPAPANPDLGTVTERFYQYVEGGHFQFAYAMLSPRYRSTLSEDDLRRRYDGLADAEIFVRHLPGTIVVAGLNAADPNDRGRRVHVSETIKFVWDGEQWTIDHIARRVTTTRALK